MQFISSIQRGARKGARMWCRDGGLNWWEDFLGRMMWNKVEYFITDCSTSCMSVLLSATRFGLSLTLQFPFIQNVLFHIVTHLDISHSMAASAPAVFRRKSPLDGAKELLSKIWKHITTVSFVSASIVVCSRKPKNASGRV